MGTVPPFGTVPFFRGSLGVSSGRKMGTVPLFGTVPFFRGVHCAENRDSPKQRDRPHFLNPNTSVRHSTSGALTSATSTSRPSTAAMDVTPLSVIPQGTISPKCDRSGATFSANPW